MNKIKLLNFLLTNNFVGEYNAVKQDDITVVLELGKREIRQAILEINEDITITRMASFCNDGIYLTNSKHELEKMRERALRAVQRNLKRVRKVDFLVNEFTQISLMDELIGDQDVNR